MTIHDWEVQAAYFNYRLRYGSEAQDRLVEMYEKIIPNQNLHLIMGTQLSRPKQFMIIGVLRTTQNIDEIARQQSLL